MMLVLTLAAFLGLATAQNCTDFDCSGVDNSISATPSAITCAADLCTTAECCTVEPEDNTTVIIVVVICVGAVLVLGTAVAIARSRTVGVPKGGYPLTTKEKREQLEKQKKRVEEHLGSA